MEQLNGLISPILILLVFSLMLSVGICAAINETTNSTNFAYTVSVGNGACSIESLFIDFGRCLNPKDILSASPVPWDSVEMMDRSGAYIKFDKNIEPPSIADPARSMIYSFELAGKWSEKLAPITADFVTAGGICSKDIKGPDC